MEQASRQALPALLGGIQANTDDPGGASSFARAVEQAGDVARLDAILGTVIWEPIRSIRLCQ